MSEGRFKAPNMKRSQGSKESEGWSPPKKKNRRPEKKDVVWPHKFIVFCDVVLQHEKYEETIKREESLRKANNRSPIDSAGADSFSSESTSSSYSDDVENHAPSQTLSGNAHKDGVQRTIADDDNNSVTCFCGKPYGGRAMIQCDECFTWLHCSCAKVRTSNIPDVFICAHCKDSKAAKRKSGRMPVFGDKTITPPHS